MRERYIFFYLEIARRKKKDLNIYSYENVSHVPTSKLVEIFRIDLENDPQIVDGYFLTKKMYKTHKTYIRKEFPPINLRIFKYCLRQYATNSFEEVRKLYKENLME